MEYSELYEGMEVQMYHHHNSTSGDFSWKTGTVVKNTKVLNDPQYYFKPEQGPTLLILPHRMDEIMAVITLNNTFFI